MSDILLKHRQLLEAEIMPWMDAWIKISFISLCLSLSLSTSPSFTFSQILLPQVYLWWSRVTYLSQDSHPSLYSNFSLHHPIPYQIYKRWCQKKSSVGLQTLHFGHPTPNLPIVSPFGWPADQLICMRSPWSHIWLRDQHIFNHVNMRSLARTSLSYRRPHLDNKVLRIC